MLKDNSKQTSVFDQYYYEKVIPENHLLRLLNKYVDFTFVRDILTDRYSEDRGRPAEQPEFMFKVCLLEYLYNHSDVQVVENIRLNLAYRWFLGLNIDEEVPDDTTISHFRVKRVGLEKFQEIFQRIIDQCIEKGFIGRQPGRAIVDATHIIANVAIPTWLDLVRQAFEKVVCSLEGVDKSLADGFQQRYEKLREELKGKTRDEKLPLLLDLAAELLETAGPLLNKNGETDPSITVLAKVISDRNDKAKDRIISIVDLDAREGHKTDMCKIQGYKDHIMIDEGSEIITAVKVTPANEEDGNQFIELIEQFQDSHGVLPAEIVADKGYWSGKNLRFLHEENITGHISRAKTRQNTTNFFGPEDFQFNPDKMEVTCPNGVTTNKYVDQTKQHGGYYFSFKKSQCKDCLLRSKCTSSRSKRLVFISVYYFDLKRGREHYKSEEYKQGSKNRWLIERKHADKVKNHGLRKSRYLGLERTWIHSLLSSIASNVKRMVKLIVERQRRDQPALLPV